MWARLASRVALLLPPPSARVLRPPSSRTVHAVSALCGKSKDRGKEKSGKTPARVEINPMVMEELVPVARLRETCVRALDKMKDEFAKNLSLRSTTGALDSLPVRFSGRQYELQELAQIVRKNPKTMVLHFVAFPQAIPDALKAIQASGLNVNPQQDGTTLFVPVPKVTKEHREALARNAKIIYIKCRDSIKSTQNEYLKKAKKPGVSEDLIRNVQSQITALCEQYLTETRNLYMAKNEELLGKDSK